VNWLLTQQGFWAVLGTIIGATVVSTTNIGIQWWQRRQQRQIASMRVAIDLRHWLGRVVGRLYDTQNWDSSDGLGGKPHVRIPRFRFERSLDIVSTLDRRTAREIFDLIHEKNSRNSGIAGTLEFQTEDEAIDEFRGSSAHLCNLGLITYRKMAKTLKWSVEGLSARSEEMIKKETERFQKLQDDRTSFDNKFFCGSADGTADAQIPPKTDTP
jgi:hypothetical protein